jgi:hypothetical protein
MQSISTQNMNGLRMSGRGSIDTKLSLIYTRVADIHEMPTSDLLEDLNHIKMGLPGDPFLNS